MFMMSISHGSTGSGALMSSRSSAAISIAGDLHNGFVRVKCRNCNHEYLLAFSCMRCHFCPSCHQKRVVEFGEWLCMDILKKVPHRHFVAPAL